MKAADKRQEFPGIDVILTSHSVLTEDPTSRVHPIQNMSKFIC